MTLQTETEIRMKAMSMNLVAQEAARRFASYLMAEPASLDDHDKISKHFGYACLGALHEAEHDIQDTEFVQRWLEKNREDVFLVGISIISVTIDEAQKHRKRNIIGRVAGIAAGVALGAFFG